MPVNKSGKLIFELSRTAKKRMFKSVLDDVLERDANLGLPQIFRNQDCVRPSMFVHRYPNGRRFLIEVNTENSEEKTIKVLK